ncbi:MAG: U32 family peptidase [Treponema sp.]|jgi:putative protease|nr:U32 family peptidase [Treponema sp.]
MKPVELLAPAGSSEALDAAIGEGADAVYLGLKNFNARMRSANFAYSQFEGALRTLHRMGRKLYVTVNTVFEQREADRMYQLLKYLAALGPDGLIVQDFGVITMVREHFPSLRLHASTQMNIASARGANLLSRQGFSRAVLARELNLDEIRHIRANTNLELEVFVHGALCISESGLCLFSSYLGGKSANRGMCTQGCRRFYRREEEGGYYFSPSDLQLLELVPALADAGVASFKIEGRMKSAEYVGTVVSAYRRVIDAISEHDGAFSGNADEGSDPVEGPVFGQSMNRLKPAVKQAVSEGLDILRNDFARSKTIFYFNKYPDWLNPSQNGGVGIALGKILRVKGQGTERRALIPGGLYSLAPGDSIRLHRRDDSNRVPHKLASVEKASLEDAGDAAGHVLNACLWISIPEGFDTGDSVYLIQTKSMSKRYPPVIPHNLDAFKRSPGRDRAPPPELQGTTRNVKAAPAKAGQGMDGRLSDQPRHKAARGCRKKAAVDEFPEGLYAAVPQVQDLYIVQSVRPVKAMLQYNSKTAAFLMDEKKPPLPFSPQEIILVLDPYLPESLDMVLAGQIPVLLSRGYRQFVVNNPGHFSYFRNQGACLIAGPYLYVFNRWANAFTVGLGAEYFVSPLENNRQNLERTVDAKRRRFTFVTVFAYPPLFRIRADLSASYDFGAFLDSQDEEFHLVSNPDGSIVYPEKPFSIIDKTPFLQQAGFNRFILDFSGPVLKKNHYRELMDAVKKASVLPGGSRFNWKNGFYHTEDTGSHHIQAGG